MNDCVRRRDIREDVDCGSYRRSVEDFAGFADCGEHVRFLSRQWRKIFVDLLSFSASTQSFMLFLHVRRTRGKMVRDPENKSDDELSLLTAGRNSHELAPFPTHRVSHLPKQWVIANPALGVCAHHGSAVA
jgi:hypothetical protein